MLKKLFIFIFCMTLTAISPAIADKLQIEQFIDPATCGDCHTDIYEQWSGSMHNKSHDDPLYSEIAAFLRKGLREKAEIAEAESCVKCHTPVGNITGFPLKTSDDRKKTPEIATKGIQCDYCHSATAMKKPYNNGLIISPGNGEDEPGIKRGPYKNSESDFHDSAFSEFHTDSAICGTCHNVRHVVFGTVLESTYTEWLQSPYNSKNPKKTVNCQDCHMYQRPGIPATGSTKRPANKGSAAEDGPDRDHVFTHYFIGGNSALPAFSGDSVKEKMAAERLQNTAELSVDASLLKKGKLVVNIKNTGAGHSLPTGLTDVRQMWLEVVVSDEKEKHLFTSGLPDKNGYLPEGTVQFHTIFGDGKGKPVANIAKAKEVLYDKRIPPLKEASETFAFKSSEKVKLKIRVRLLYRSTPQRLVDALFGKGKMKLPVTEMERVEIQVPGVAR